MSKKALGRLSIIYSSENGWARCSNGTGFASAAAAAIGYDIKPRLKEIDLGSLDHGDDRPLRLLIDDTGLTFCARSADQAAAILAYLVAVQVRGGHVIVQAPIDPERAR